MKISGIELKSVVDQDRPGHLLVLTSDSGLAGTGQIAADGEHPELSSVVLADLVVGRDPFDVEALLMDARRRSDGTIDEIALVSAAASAMLDLASRSIDAPIAQLLAGSTRDHARACAVQWTGGATNDHQLAAAARETVDEGYTMLRVEAFAAHDEVDLDAATERVRLIRSAVGDGADIVVSVSPRLTPSAAEQFAHGLAPLEPLWIEDLVPSWPPDPLERISGRLNQPLAAGRGVTPDISLDLARGSLVDHLIVDPGRVGGLLEARRIAALAEIYHVGVIAACSGGSVSLRDALQLAAVVPNFSVIEVPRGLAQVERGSIPIGHRPGPPHRRPEVAT
jgi:galactonate dehydratase